MIFFFIIASVICSSLGIKIATPKATPDPYWIPVDPKRFPAAKPTDRIEVLYLKAPLLEAEIGPLFGYFDVFHGGLAFRNLNTNFTWTVNYDSVDLNLFSSQLPIIQKSQNGTATLQWKSAGELYCYNGIHPKFWVDQKIGTIPGTVYNKFVPWVASFNATWPYYEMFNVGPVHGGHNYLSSHECFDFVLLGIAQLGKLGAPFHGGLKRNEVTLYTHNVPKLVDISKPGVWGDIVEFYEVLGGSWGQIKDPIELLRVLFDVAFGKVFYLHVGDQYYEFDIAFPLLGVKYLTVQY